jgi:hypothetical protein
MVNRLNVLVRMGTVGVITLLSSLNYFSSDSTSFTLKSDLEATCETSVQDVVRSDIDYTGSNSSQNLFSSGTNYYADFPANYSGEISSGNGEAVPEPATWALFALATAGSLFARRKYVRN